MKHLWNLLVIIVLFVSCGDDYTMIPVWGKINGKSFDVRNAIVDDKTDQFKFHLFSISETVTDSCTITSDFSNVSFEARKSKGKVDLFFDSDTATGKTVTFFDPNGQVSNVASNGFYDIVEIEDNEITVYIDARFDTSSFIEGLFVAYICD